MVTALFATVALMFFVLPLPALCCAITRAKLNQLHGGMTYEELTAVMGCEATKHLDTPDAVLNPSEPSSTASYEWTDGGVLFANFLNGKLQSWSGYGR